MFCITINMGVDCGHFQNVSFLLVCVSYIFFPVVIFHMILAEMDYHKTIHLKSFKWEPSVSLMRRQVVRLFYCMKNFDEKVLYKTSPKTKNHPLLAFHHLNVCVLEQVSVKWVTM